MARWAGGLTRSYVGRGHAEGLRPWVLTLARFGYVTKGFVYGLIGVLALRSSLGSHAQSRDPQGALKAVSPGPLGKTLIAFLAVGLACYALWRLTEAVLDPRSECSGWKGAIQRVIRGG